MSILWVYYWYTTAFKSVDERLSWNYDLVIWYSYIIKTYNKMVHLHYSRSIWTFSFIQTYIHYNTVYPHIKTFAPHKVIVFELVSISLSLTGWLIDWRIVDIFFQTITWFSFWLSQKVVKTMRNSWLCPYYGSGRKSPKWAVNWFPSMWKPDRSSIQRNRA